MSDHVYKIIELVGSSKKSIDDAVQNSIKEAAKTVQTIRWFQVVETRGYVEENAIAYWLYD